MKFRFVLVGVLLSLAFSQAQAAREWIFKGVMVKDVSTYHTGSENVLTVRFDPSPQTASTGCVPTDAHNMVSFWTTGSLVSSSAAVWTSVFLSAQAQNLPVDIYVEANVCNTSARGDLYGEPKGFGMRLRGVRLAND
jgi:hypothetical protein